jgi:hypothetical protein
LVLELKVVLTVLEAGLFEFSVFFVVRMTPPFSPGWIPMA